MSGPERILVRSPTWVGDAVMATPALRALRAAHPQAEIVAEGRPALADLLGPLPSIDAYLPDAGAVVPRTRALRACHFDWAVLLPDSVRAALGPFLARIPRRAGYARDPLRRALVTEALEVPRCGGRRLPLGGVERYLGITRYLGCPDRGHDLELRVEPRAREQAALRLAAQGVCPDEDVLLVTPGASYGPSKRWPPGHFAAACDGIARRLGLRPVVAPAPGETGLARAVAERAQTSLALLLDPPLRLAELVALIERARLVLSNDTGPRHAAAALGTPVVVAIGPTNPAHSAGGARNERVLRVDVPCSPCQLRVCPIDQRCLTRVGPERAVAAAESLLG